MKNFYKPSIVQFIKRSMSCKKNASQKNLVGIIQMTSTSNKDENIKQATNLICSAKEKGVKMVFLPESCDFIGENKEQSLLLSESIDGSVITHYRTLAKKLDVWISIGGFHQKHENFEEDNRIKNTHVVIDASGEIQGKYSKTHLFDVDIKGKVCISERSGTIPGTDIGPPVDSPVGKLGLGIDLRFPEFSLALSQQGAEILLYPSAFMVPTGIAHWKVLLQCRAVENQCFVIAAAQVGQHNAKRSSYGHSMIVDPWGTILAECSDEIGFCVAEIDHTFMQQKRLEMPIVKHRRHDLYGHVLVKAKGNIDSQTEYIFGQYVVPSSAVFYKTSLSFAFVNKKPVLPGHVLICPIRPVERFSELSSAEVADIFICTQQVAKVIEKEYGGSSATIAIQDGPEAGQTVTHVHVHILPRKVGDFDRNDDIYDKLENHDKNVKASDWRSDQDMAEEAAQLRPLFL